MEMRLIVGKMLWWNDVRRVEGGNEVWDLRNEYQNMTVYTNWSKRGLRVRLRVRGDL